MTVRVLVVDDSAFARKVMREVLTRPGIEVVGIARDGLEALELTTTLKPDVITLDLVMPNLDGLGVLASLPQGPDGPRVVVVSMSGEDSTLGLAALQAGAISVVQKPTALAVDRLYDLADPLVASVLAAAAARPLASVEPETPLPPAVIKATRKSLLVLGASTGGPQALTRILKTLPASFPIPIALVLHLPRGYTKSFAERLDNECALEVVEAESDLALTPGRAVVGRAGHHLKLRRVGGVLRAVLDLTPTVAAHRPSVDALFGSAAEVAGSGVLGVVLTGMGDDGLLGARAIKAAGGELITESESSCVVYGMPRCVQEAGLSAASVPLGGVVAEVLRRI